MRAVLDIVLIIINLATWVIIIHAIISTLLSFNVLSRSNQFVMTIFRGLDQVLQPVLSPIRRRLPRSSIDFSPLILILGLLLLERIIAYYIYPNVF